ncbi:MAG: hypothetical protein JRJ84_00025 [Deltaproteobacteria bacterium]|nr:hypothetical protein [Deltaproteobacteria bacterium]
MKEAIARQTLLGLPVTAWARRMKRGALSMGGHVGGLDLEVGGLPLRVERGRVELVADFIGGAQPTLRQLVVRGSMLVTPAGRSSVRGRELVLHDQRIHLDKAEIPRAMEGVGSGRLLAGLVGAMSDVELRARAEPDGDVLLKMGHGLEVAITHGALLTVRGATRGPADRLVLSRPLEIGFGGDGIRLNHGQLRWLSRLAKVRIDGATLHPDGSVNLEGRAAPGFNTAVQGGLHTASAKLSSLIRRSPGIRRFLRHEVG